MDENLTYLSEQGEVLDYTSGHDGDRYHAMALVKMGDEYLTWHYSKSFDYEEIKPRYKRGMSAERMVAEDYRLYEAANYDPEYGVWETLDENEEQEARAVYLALVVSCGYLEPMTVDEVRDELNGTMRYKGQRYSAWEPNY